MIKRDPDGLMVCTKSDPWRGEPGRVRHPDAKFIESIGYHDDGSEFDSYRCPHCGHAFRVEVPR